MDDDVQKQLEEAAEEAFEGMRCYRCNTRTDRLITFLTEADIIQEFECLDCRQERVQEQVDKGLRPASDLLPENLPERRNPL